MSVELMNADSLFGPNEEGMIISHLLEFPDPCKVFIADLKPEFFTKLEYKYIMGWIANLTKELGSPPSREIVLDKVKRHLTVDDDWQPVLAAINRKQTSHAEATRVRGLLRNFVEHRRVGKMYSDEVITAYHKHDFTTVKEAMMAALQPVFVEEQVSERCGLITCAELRKRVKKQDWLVDGVAVAGKPMFIGGKKKSLKTGIACDLAVSIATGRDFLGNAMWHVQKPRKVAFFSAESGDDDINDYLSSIAIGKGLGYSDEQDDYGNLQVSFEPAELSNAEYLVRFEQTLKAGGFNVVIADPMYLMLLVGSDANAANLYDMGAVLAPLTATCKRAGCTFIGVHHFKKTASDELDLDDFTYAGIAEYARQSILVGRVAPYTDAEHNQLKIRVHGHGRGGLYQVNIAESKWQVHVQTMTEVNQQQAKNKEAVLVERLLTALDEIDHPALKEEIKTEAGMSGETANRAINLALEEGAIVTDASGQRPLYRRRTS